MIPTYSGFNFDPFTPDRGKIDIRDIAHHLANTNRFNGALPKPVSVAQHSVYVARLVEDPSGPRQDPIALQGLLHDASEAYLGDISYALKKNGMFSRYKRVESILRYEIFQKFGCPTQMTLEVAKADELMARYEAYRSFGDSIKLFGDELYHYFKMPEEPLVTKEEIERVGRWQPWSWRKAEEVFLAEFKRFGPYDYHVLHI